MAWARERAAWQRRGVFATCIRCARLAVNKWATAAKNFAARFIFVCIFLSVLLAETKRVTAGRRRRTMATFANTLAARSLQFVETIASF